MSVILALEGVCKSYGALKVTDGITLSVTQGERVYVRPRRLRVFPRESG